MLSAGEEVLPVTAMRPPFKQRAVCGNGHVLDEVPFGDLFHYHAEVCPECGDPKANWRVMTLRRCDRPHWDGVEEEAHHAT